MSNSRPKHTPGPWVCQQYAKCFGIKAESGRQIAIMTEHHGDEPQTPMYQFDRSAQDAADARLIAAAPEMLEALERIVGIVKTRQQYTEKDFVEALLMFAPSIIAKARGES